MINSRRLRKLRAISTASAKSLNKDYISIAFYLSIILRNASELPRSGASFLCKLIKESGYYNKAKAVLDDVINNFEKHKFIVPLEKQNKDDIFDKTAIPYKYDIDRIIDANFYLEGDYYDIQIDLLRCLFVKKEPTISDILTRIFLSDDSDENSINTISEKSKKSIFSTRKLNFLIKKVGLSKEEALLLYAKFRFATIPELEEYYSYYNTEDNSFFSEILNISVKEYRKITSQSQKLKSYGFLNENNEIDPDLVNCIIDQTLEPFFSDFLTPINSSKAYGEKSFSVPKETTNVINKLLAQNSPSSILLYGKPGSGKTEYAKSLAKTSGLKTYIYKNEQDLYSQSQSLSRLNCYLSIKQEDSLIIIDEADSLLQTITFSFFGFAPSPSKGIINKMLENKVNKTIWIVNHLNQIDESTRRRFTMSYKFEQMPLSMLRSITKTKLSSLKLSDSLTNSLLELLDKYSVTGASVDNIIQTIKSLKDEDDKTLINSVKIVLEENAKLLDGNSKRIRETVKKSYNPNVINTSISADSIINMVENAIKYSENNNSCENGIRMLFYGISGSGKTELVRYISQKLNKPILLKRASDILGKFVGENEQNIRNAFAEAATENKILLFDEADSFFADRSSAHSSWERTMTNEFLTQMEEFPGILICTTNLKEIMDPAMQRRFHILVEFKPLTKDGIKTLLESYFSNLDFSDYEIDRLESQGTVTPGDFGSLSSRIRFMNQDDLDEEYIINELIKIQKDKNGLSNHKTVGFAV